MKLIVDRLPGSCIDCVFCEKKTCGLNIGTTQTINPYKERPFNCPLEKFSIEHYRHLGE